MKISWRPVRANLRPFLLGFVERVDDGAGPALMLPFGMPVIHIDLAAMETAQVRLCAGLGHAMQMPARDACHTFVIALGFAGAFLLSSTPMPLARETFVDLEGASWRDLARRLAVAPDFQARADIAERALACRLEAADKTPSTTHRVADAIVQDRWSGTVHDLSAAAGMEERTLRNRFGRELGCSPKRLLKVARFNRVLRTVHPRAWTSRPEADVRLEFFDDCHFHRDFVQHCGVSPAAFTAAKQRSGDPTLHSISLASLGTG